MQRELYESSLLSARSVLELLGEPAAIAEQTIRQFNQHNLQMLESMRPFHKDQSKLISAAKESRRQLEEQFAEQRRQTLQEQSNRP